MKKMSYFSVFALCAVLMLTHGDCRSTEEDRWRVVEDMLRDSSSLVRPDGEGEEPLSVTIDFTLTSIDVSEGRLDTVGYLHWSWVDPRLAFSPDQAESVRVDPKFIWTPDIELYNSGPAGLKILNRQDRALVYPGGWVDYIPMVAADSVCDMTTENMEGTYNCSLKFGSWTYSGLDLVLSVRGPEVDMSSFIPNRDWEVVDTAVYLEEKHYPCCPEPYFTAVFSFRIRPRRSSTPGR